VIRITRRTAVDTLSEVPAAWRNGLPVCQDAAFVLREVQPEDAPSLLAHLATDEVSRFIAPPPATVTGFEQFIRWSQRDREAGRSVCFAIVPAGATRAVGLFQLRSLDASFANAEWGFAMGSAYWGTGLFVGGATQVLDFAFETVGVIRLEARAVVVNGRGNGALRKIGAVQEGVLRRSFVRGGQHYDQVMWSMLAEDWHRRRSLHRIRIH
jgi:ribosomal-protein-alanine N-acetyltransferase